MVKRGLIEGETNEEKDQFMCKMLDLTEKWVLKNLRISGEISARDMGIKIQTTANLTLLTLYHLVDSVRELGTDADAISQAWG